MLTATGQEIKNANKVADFLEALATNGFVVTPICDGIIQHHSKRATVYRCEEQEKSRIEAMKCKLEIAASNDPEQIKDLDSRLKRYKKRSRSNIQHSFANDLKNILDERQSTQQKNHHDTSGGRVCPLLKIMHC